MDSTFPCYPILKDKIVLITGASAGIGKACSRYFAASGSHLILGARRVDKLEELRSELIKQFPATKLHLVELDVRSMDSVQKMAEGLPKEFQEVDILINNAGLALDVKTTVDTSLEDMNAMIDTNVKGLFHVTKAIVPGMMSRNRGHIINVSSIAGHEAYKGGSLYCASKFAVEAITKSLRKEVVSTPLRVTSIAPGLTETEFSIVRFKGDAAKAKAVYTSLKTPPLNGNDIAETILFAASRPPHVQILDLIVAPTCQASAEVVARNE